METEFEPPDGGYGWVIVFASVLNNFLMAPLIQNIVLIFKDKMLEIDMTITQMWFALNVHSSFTYITHLFNNLLLKQFGYRKVTVAGVTFVFVGFGLSSWIHNYMGFMVTFGLVIALGVGLNTSSYTFAIKTYFTHNQNKAIALSMTLTALGPILMPQIINLLIQHYSSDGVILILAAIMAHAYIGAVLLQPVKKHLIKAKKTEEEDDMDEFADALDRLRQEAMDEPEPLRQFQPMFGPKEFMTNRKHPGFRRKDSVISISYEQEQAAIMGFDSMLGGSLYSLESVNQRRSISIGPKSKILTQTTWWKSEDSINLDSCYNIFDEENTTEKVANDNAGERDQHKDKEHTNNVQKHFEEEKMFIELSTIDTHNLPRYQKWFYRAVEMFGLDIFLDLRYVNIMIGLSLIILVEVNFTVLLPFLLFEYSLTIQQIAAFLSILGAADILFRFLAPQVGDYLNQPSRIMLLLVLSTVIAVRTALIFVSNYPAVLIVAVILGCLKGLRVVYMSLVIPSYVPQERLAAASAIQIISNSIFSLLGGHLIGITRTNSGSYIYCVMLLNSLSALAIAMWAADILYKKYRRSRMDKISNNLVIIEEVY